MKDSIKKSNRNENKEKELRHTFMLVESKYWKKMEVNTDAEKSAKKINTPGK